MRCLGQRGPASQEEKGRNANSFLRAYYAPMTLWLGLPRALTLETRHCCPTSLDLCPHQNERTRHLTQAILKCLPLWGDPRQTLMLDCPAYIPQQGILKIYKFHIRHNQKGKSNTKKKIRFSLKPKGTLSAFPCSRPFLTSSAVLSAGRSREVKCETTQKSTPK